MIVYLYRWKITPGKEQQFQDAWSRVTRLFKEHCGSYGSRLHRAHDGEWIGYAQWPSVEARRDCNLPSLEFKLAQAQMREAIEISSEEQQLEIMGDFLDHAPANLNN